MNLPRSKVLCLFRGQTLRRNRDPYDHAPVRLRVIEIVRKNWFRSHLLVEAEESGELFFGNFSMGSTVNFQQHRYRLVQGQRIYLVCRGGDWEVGAEVPRAKIVYRYEP